MHNGPFPYIEKKDQSKKNIFSDINYTTNVSYKLHLPGFY